MRALMDIIKTEHEVDPLAIRTSDTRDVEEERPLSEGDSCILITMKDELKQEVTVEEDEVFTESSWNMDENETPEAKRPSDESCRPSDDPAWESALHPQLLRRNENLQLLTLSRTDSGSLKFDICRKIVPFTYSPGVHHSSHGAGRKFKCEICGKCFARSVTLTEHARTHTGEKPMQCDVCEKRFAAARLLAAHLRTHGGDKPYECDVCGKRFSQKRSLKTHLRKHVEPSNSNYEKHSSLSL
ncbi:hypermethylated in cancer 2 protein-like isoform X2 [Periplaneta americana]|uniref:hypermethylated in cancer 2 protein-like isoform X2 n=2 Tax=Periplaneta americana TaxID=6978 RepID=UPI0037E765B4